MWNSRVVKKVRSIISSVLCIALIASSVKIPTYASEYPGGSNSNGENELINQIYGSNTGRKPFSEYETRLVKEIMKKV